MTPERGHFERGRWVPEIAIMVNGSPVVVDGLSVSFRTEPAPMPHIPIGHYEKGRFIGGCFERKGDRLVCTNPGAVNIHIPLKS